MKSPEHAAIGLVVSLVGVGALASYGSYGTPTLVALVVAGVFLSVFIDLDHFVLERLYTGEWGALRRCLSSPVAAFTEQGEGWIFDDGTALENPRLASHVVIGLVLVGGLAVADVAVAAFFGVIVLAHVTADVLRDNEIA